MPSKFALTPEHVFPDFVLKRLPSPRFWARVQRCLPAGFRQRIAQELLSPRLLGQLPADRIRFLQGRTLAIQCLDMDLRLVLTVEQDQIRVLDEKQTADATVEANTLDLLLLASQLEDADTLFFHRRLRMTGDTALGLQARNLMDQLPIDQINPHLGLMLNHFSRMAKAAHRARYANPH